MNWRALTRPRWLSRLHLVLVAVALIAVALWVRIDVRRNL
jgi:hypothetical protein